MTETLLIKFLKSLSLIELKQFRDFVKSPSFNKNKKLSDLCEIHINYFPDFQSEELTEQKLFEALFKDEKFEYFRIKNLISDLFGLGKEFLTFNVYRKDQNYKEKYLLQELRNRNLDVAFEKTFKNAEKQIEKSKIIDEFYFLHKMEVRSELMYYLSPKKPNVNFHFFQERLDLFINYSAITLLKLYNIMMHEKIQNNFDFDMKMYENVMEYLGKNKIKDNPTLEVYYNILLLEKTRDQKYFYLLKDLWKKYRDSLTSFDNYMLYLHLDGFCATAFNAYCRTDLLIEQFQLMKENLMFKIEGSEKILYPDFLNEVKKAARVKEFKYAEDYIEKYKSILTDEIENTLNFCYGYISYQKGEFEKALDYFSKTNFSNFIIKIQVKIHLLQLYFDLQYYDQAILMIDTFKHYLTREKSILEIIKVSLFEFLKISGDLIKLKTDVHNSETEYKIDKIKRDIEKMSDNRFGIKLWLREKVKSKIQK